MSRDLTPHWNRVARLEDVAYWARELIHADEAEEYDHARYKLTFALDALGTTKRRSEPLSTGRSHPRPDA
jgi:hypothetical protein